MSESDSFKKRYKDGDIPWDIERPDFNLIKTVLEIPINCCKALEIGCGTGDNSIWLAQKKFKVTGTDISEIAIETAKEKALQANAKCTFIALDFLKNKIDGSPFGFAYDRGCFHSFGLDRERKKYAKNVAAHLKKGGLWLSLIGSADDKPRDTGPPMRTARDIVKAVEPYFEILSLVSSHFESNRPSPAKAWVCLMRKRNIDS
jgi:SAM-dependent methyltransferase